MGSKRSVIEGILIHSEFNPFASLALSLLCIPCPAEKTLPKIEPTGNNLILKLK